MYTFGSALKNELEGVEGKNKEDIKRKQERILQKWLDLPRKFRNPGVVGPGAKDSDVEQEFTVRGQPQ